MHTNPRRLIGLCALGLLGLTSCAADSKSSSAATAPVANTTAMLAESAMAPAATDAPAGTAAAASAADLSLTSTGRPAALPVPLVNTLAVVAKVTVEVEDVRIAIVDLPELVLQHGGVIYDTDVQVGDPQTAVATVTIKVPPNELEPLVLGLGGVGRLIDRSQQTEDVGDQLVDVGARIATAQASVERVRVLLADAQNLAEITSIEAELTLRETALEQLLAQQRNTLDRVATSTLTVVFTPTPLLITEDPVKVVAVGHVDSVGGAFGIGWRNFTTVIHRLVIFVGYTLPFFAALSVLLAAGLVARRRVVRVKAVPTQSR